MAAAVVAITVGAAVPHTAWLPWSGRLAPADAWQAVPDSAARALADVQILLGAAFWPSDHVAGAIGVAAGLAAASTLVLTVALRAAGLGFVLAPLVALLAASGPLLAWQAGSPLGAAPATLVSTLLLWRLVRQRVRVHVTWFGSLAAVGTVAVGLATLIGLAALVASWRGAPPASATLRLLRGDLGLIGLLLCLPALGRRHSALVPRERVWLGAAAFWLLTTPATPITRAAILLPWTWWLVGAGIAQLVAWRGRHASRWATVGVCIWIALHAARVPWGQQRQLAVLARTWANGVVARVDEAHPLAGEDSAAGWLAAALALGEPRGRIPLVIPASDVREATRAGRHPLLVDLQPVERLRWSGVALDAVPGPIGVSLERVLDEMPGGTIVLAAISREAARTFGPAQWQALGRVGLRLPDAGTPRAHVLAGVTRARVEALEAARPDAARLDVQPGDPLGRTGDLSPVDARLEADATIVRVRLRDRPFLQQEGLALLFFSTRGDFLGWRSGLTAAHLDGPPVGDGPLARRLAFEALPCVDVPAGHGTDLGGVVNAGAIGVTWAAPGDVQLRVARPPGVDESGLRVVGNPSEPTLPRLAQGASGVHTLARSSSHRAQVGVLLRGPVARLEATATVPIRVCAAWPVPHALDLATTHLEMPVHPRFEPHFAAGWHDMEPLAGGGYFRWMAGPRAEVLLPLRRVAPLHLVLDAQGVVPPRPGDAVRLTVNGRALDARPLHATRGLYAWEVPADALRRGPNTFVFDTNQTLRPADVTPGADTRRLGLLVYGWTLGPSPARRPGDGSR